MKKWILVMAMLVCIGATAQQGKRRYNGEHPQRDKSERLTAEQRTELQVKKLTLTLDLTDAQQKEIKKLMLDRSKKREAAIAAFKAGREAGKKPSKDERFERKSHRLDEQIAMKREMKKILDAAQYEKFTKMREMHQRKAIKHSRKAKFHKRK
ncbi:hypothetical protein [Flavobacterium rhizosphaerae]|uniref:LTXXQ motif family protein n=1 Tax=Flavobacterium rhizosphaerae TaxID=3163298 RepID=A0ABW8YX30_9FLAO